MQFYEDNTLPLGPTQHLGHLLLKSSMIRHPPDICQGLVKCTLYSRKLLNHDCSQVCMITEIYSRNMLPAPEHSTHLPPLLPMYSEIALNIFYSKTSISSSQIGLSLQFQSHNNFVFWVPGECQRTNETNSEQNKAKNNRKQK